MKRSDFLKKLGIGLGVAVVAPAIIANSVTAKQEWNYVPQKAHIPIKEKQGNISLLDEFYVGLFYRDNELSYKGYERQQSFWHNYCDGCYKPFPVSFPQTNRGVSIKADSARLFSLSGNPMGEIPFPNDCWVVDGVITIQW